MRNDVRSLRVCFATDARNFFVVTPSVSCRFRQLVASSHNAVWWKKQKKTIFKFGNCHDLKSQLHNFTNITKNNNLLLSTGAQYMM